MRADLERPLLGPAIAAAPDAEWIRTLAALRVTAGTLTLNRGWDLTWERGTWERSAAGGREHLSIRLSCDEVVIGPLWVPGSDAGCAGCAEVRGRIVMEHPLADDLRQPCAVPRTHNPMLPEQFAAAVAHLANRPLRPGELYVAGGPATRRHRVPRSVYCPLCGPGAVDADPVPVRRPGRLVLRHHLAAPDNPTRGANGARLVTPDWLRDRLVDPRFGPVLGIMRGSTTPFAASLAVVPDSPAMGHGRALTFAETQPVAILEAYERLGGFPFDAPVLTNLAYTQVAGQAVDPGTLGRYTGEQLGHPTCRVMPFTETTPMDWVWGHELPDGEPVLVPADVGFYQYEYRYRRARRAARAAGARKQQHYFQESSSGCAMGSCFEEAALHALFELAERDAFLIAWHRASPLPAITRESVTDPDSRAVIEFIEARGYEVHLLVVTQDIQLPVVWVLAVHRAGGFPLSFSSAGSGAEPSGAIRSALQEVAHLVTNPVDWQRSDIEPMLDDPWLVQELEHHVQFYSLPQTLPRVTAALGGPPVTLKDSFPGWPQTLRRAARGDVRGALEFVASLFHDAGLARIVLVDQTNREHAGNGMAVVKAVVPGITPMCFGHAQQRLAGLPRLAASLAGTPQASRAIPYDPHPFP
jgi:ribosomal protein S12 methylthiotransferase accessory factor